MTSQPFEIAGETEVRALHARLLDSWNRREAADFAVLKVNSNATSTFDDEFKGDN